MPPIVWHADARGRGHVLQPALVRLHRHRPGGVVAARTGTGSSTPTTSRPPSRAGRKRRASGTAFTMAYRFRAADGSYRWHLGRAVPERDADGAIVSWVGAAADIDDQKRAEERQQFLVEAGARWASSLDYRRTLADVARAAVPAFADWCTSTCWSRAASCAGSRSRTRTRARSRSCASCRSAIRPTRPPSRARAHVVRTGRLGLMTEIPAELLHSAAVDDLHLDLLTELGLRSYICVPLAARAADLRRAHLCPGRVGPELRRDRPRARRGAGPAGRGRDRQRAALRAGRVARAGRAGARLRRRRRLPARCRGRGPALEPGRGGDHRPRGRGRGRAARSGAIPGWARARRPHPVASGPGEAGRRRSRPRAGRARALALLFRRRHRVGTVTRSAT